jgi:hypothetical protein
LEDPGYLRLPAEAVACRDAHRIEDKLHVQPRLFRNAQSLAHCSVVQRAENVAVDLYDRGMAELAAADEPRSGKRNERCDTALEDRRVCADQ